MGRLLREAGRPLLFRRGAPDPAAEADGVVRESLAQELDRVYCFGMPRATVAYESAAEARRKLKAVKPLRWHRQREGLYTAKGVRGAYSLLHRSPD